jgi:gamma-butyrobetaine dioxygenase
MLAAVAIEAAGAALALHWVDGRVDRLPAVWLRDNAQDAQTRHPGNGQRLLTIHDIPADLRVTRATLNGAGTLDLTFTPGGYRTRFTTEWLATTLRGPPAPAPVLWDAAYRPYRAAWPLVADDDAALRDWLAAVASHGVAVLSDVPCADRAVERVVARFGYIRETNYGRVFDVRSEVSPSNLAYTRLGLQVHTDNPYRDPVPGLQLLHCLANSAAGGESIVVDGFAAAERLKVHDWAAFGLLARTAVPFRYAGPDVELVARAPIIGLDVEGSPTEIRFNNRSLGTPVLPAARLEAWYRAYRSFAELLDSPELQVVLKLSPGELLIVDNHRVLHGRTGFAGAAGARHLQGAYADRDGLLSRLAVLRRRLGTGEAT